MKKITSILLKLVLTTTAITSFASCEVRVYSSKSRNNKSLYFSIAVPSRFYNNLDFDSLLKDEPKPKDWRKFDTDEKLTNENFILTYARNLNATIHFKNHSFSPFTSKKNKNKLFIENNDHKKTNKKLLKRNIFHKIYTNNNCKKYINELIDDYEDGTFFRNSDIEKKHEYKKRRKMKSEKQKTISDFASAMSFSAEE